MLKNQIPQACGQHELLTQHMPKLPDLDLGNQTNKATRNSLTKYNKDERIVLMVV